ncbi:unnamed protein product, partial [Mesorhabditis belari]|uniref:Uncharacterized protein n=1 Tax=Mesorhabditis belari TaxID=2138241 RepID=A0AAF3EJB7_9BILA
MNKLAVRLPKSIAPVRPRFRLVSKASDISLKEILSRDAAGEILERFCKDQNFLKQTDDEGNTMLHLVIKVVLLIMIFGAERITYRPIGVPVWKRISNHLIYDFPPDNDGLPDSIYRGDLSSYPSDALNSHSPYGPTMDIESEDEDETFREFFEDYHLRHFSTFLKNGDEHFAENVISCANYPKSDLLYGVFRIKQAYVNRGVGFELPPPELCGNDKRPKKLFRIDAQITSGQSFLHTLKAIADGITKNETIKGNPMISFTKPKRDGFVHPIGAFMAYGIHEKYDVEENAVSDYARMQNGNMFFAFRGSQENDRFAYSHATFLWTAEETVLVGDKKVTKQIPLPFIYNVDFLLHEKDQMNSEPITSDEILDIINHKPKQMSLGGIRLELKWDSWSCCSACCDKLDWESWHATNCHDVLSYRTRRGLYHFTKINDAELRKNDSEGVADLFDVKPYKTTGIPVASSIWKVFPKMWKRMNKLFKLSTEEMSFVWKQVFEMADCAKDNQKKNCTAWDICHGIDRKNIPRVQNDVIDPCSGLEIMEFKANAEKMELIVEEGAVYRIVIDFDHYEQEPMEVRI